MPQQIATAGQIRLTVDEFKDTTVTHQERKARTSALLGVFAAAGALAGCTAVAPETPSGEQLYSTHCAACHGLNGEGDGPVAAVMQTTVPNLRSLTARSGGVFPVDAVTAYVDGRQMPVSHGDRQMPIWGDLFQPPEGPASESLVRSRIDAIVAFIAELQYR